MATHPAAPRGANNAGRGQLWAGRGQVLTRPEPDGSDGRSRHSDIDGNHVRAAITAQAQMQRNLCTHNLSHKCSPAAAAQLAHGTNVVLACAMPMHMTCIHMDCVTITHLQQLSQLAVHLLRAVLCQQAGAIGSILAVASLRVPQLPHDNRHELPAQGLQAALQVLCSLCQISCSQYQGGVGSHRHICPGSQHPRTVHMPGCTQPPAHFFLTSTSGTHSLTLARDLS